MRFATWHGNAEGSQALADSGSDIDSGNFSAKAISGRSEKSKIVSPIRARGTNLKIRPFSRDLGIRQDRLGVRYPAIPNSRRLRVVLMAFRMIGNLKAFEFARSGIFEEQADLSGRDFGEFPPIFFAIFAAFAELRTDTSLTAATIQSIGTGSTPSATCLSGCNRSRTLRPGTASCPGPEQHFRFGVFENARSDSPRIRLIHLSLSRSPFFELSRSILAWWPPSASSVPIASRPQWPSPAWNALRIPRHAGSRGPAAFARADRALARTDAGRPGRVGRFSGCRRDPVDKTGPHVARVVPLAAAEVLARFLRALSGVHIRSRLLRSPVGEVPAACGEKAVPPAPVAGFDSSLAIST